VAVTLLTGCVSPPPGEGHALADVRTWAIQLQGFDDPSATERLVAAPVDLLVVDAIQTQRGLEQFAMRQLVRRIQRVRGPSGHHRLCLAYLNVGQAEDYRTYWQESWSLPTESTAGQPDFLLGLDADGWPGNYPVAYWDARWQEILWGRPGALLDQILDAGFDGAYLDWVLGYADATVVARAAEAGVDPEFAMTQLVLDLRRYAEQRRPGFLLVAQNTVDLAAARPEFLAAIDGLAQEDLSFRGSASSSWDDAGSGDIAAPTSATGSVAELGRRLQAVARRGLLVLTLDYATEASNVSAAQQTSRALGLVPCVSRTPLDRLPEHVFEAFAAPQ